MTETFVLIRDTGKFNECPSITMKAHEVVSVFRPILNNRRLEYIDRAGNIAEILIRDGNFAGFGSILQEDCK